MVEQREKHLREHKLTQTVWWEERRASDVVQHQEEMAMELGS